MSTQLTDKGFQRDDLYTILQNMKTDVLRIYPDASLDPATKDGQLLGLFSNSIDQLGQVVQAVYDSGSPSTASGVTLARIVEYNGIRVINGSQSQGTVVFTGDPGRVVPKNTLIQCTANNSIFYTVAEATVGPDGTATVNVLAEDIGAVAAPANTLTKLMMPVYGVRLVTNPVDVNLGKDRETDEELRLRRSYSTATPSQSILEGIKGVVAAIPEVIQVEGYENKTDLMDSNGLPPHSFCIVVQGGDDNDIAQAIWLREPVGANQYGNTTVVIYDANAQAHPITYMRPTLVPIYMKIQITPLPGWSDSLIPVIIDNLVAWAQANWKIGSPVIQSQLFIPLNASGTTFAVNSILMGKVPGTLYDYDVMEMKFGELPQLSSNNIQVVKV